MIVDELVAILGFKTEGEADLKRFNERLKQAEKQALAVGAALGKAMAVVGAAVAAGGAFLAKGVIQTAAEFEALSVRLESLEGSSEKAKQALDWVREFAATTPLGLQESANAYAQLRTFGIDPTNGSLQAAVDTMAMAGQKADYLNGIILAMGQAWTKGKLQGEEALQLIERGVPVWELLSQAMGKSVEQVQELSQKGKLGKKEMQLLFDAMGKRAHGASEKYAKTFAGLTGKLEEHWTDFKKAIGDAGYFDAAKARLEGLMETLDRWWKDGTIDKAANAISKVFVASMNAFGVVLGRIATHVGAISRNFDKLEPYLMPIAAGLAALVAWAFPLTAAFLALAIVADDFFTYLEGGESVIGWLIDSIKEFYKTLKESDDPVGVFLSAIGRLFSGQFSLVKGGLADRLINDFSAEMDRWEQAIRDNGKLTFKIIPGSIADTVVNEWPAAVAEMWAGLKAQWDAINWSELGVTVGQGILSGLKNMGGAIRDWFASLIPDWARGMFSGASPAAAQGLSNLYGNLRAVDPGRVTAGMVNDARRHVQQNTNVSAPITINQTVTQATQAPGAAASAVGNAVSGVARQRSQYEVEPAF